MIAVKYTYNFEKLEIWKLARSLVKHIYQLTSNFPKQEQFGLIDQLRRAAVSVISNIAEGSTRTSGKSKVYMMEISYGSLTEVLCQLIIGYDLGYLSEPDLQQIRIRIEELSNKMRAFMQTLK